jgi:hypothetical protein
MKNDLWKRGGFLDSLTVRGYPKGGTFTTKLDLKN